MKLSVTSGSALAAAAATLLLADESEYARRQIDHSPYGDGRAAERIVQLMLDRAWEVDSHPASVTLAAA